LHQSLFLLVRAIIFIKCIETILFGLIIWIPWVLLLWYPNQIFNVYVLRRQPRFAFWFRCCFIFWVVFFTSFTWISICAIIIIVIVGIICWIMSICPFLGRISLMSTSPSVIWRFVGIIVNYTFIVSHHLLSSHVPSIIVLLLSYYLLCFIYLVFFNLFLLEHLFLWFKARKESTKPLRLESSTTYRAVITCSTTFCVCLSVSQYHYTLSFCIFLAWSLHSWSLWMSSLFDCLPGCTSYCKMLTTLLFLLFLLWGHKIFEIHPTTWLAVVRIISKCICCTSTSNWLKYILVIETHVLISTKLISKLHSSRPSIKWHNKILDCILADSRFFTHFLHKWALLSVFLYQDHSFFKLGNLWLHSLYLLILLINLSMHGHHLIFEDFVLFNYHLHIL